MAVAQFVEGVLRYNPGLDRFGIWRGEKGWYIEGLHCGMCLDVWQAGTWEPTRIEYGGNPEGWYLVDMTGCPLEGMRCRWHVGW